MVGPTVERSSAAARQLASRARRRVKGAAAQVPDADLTRQRRVVDAFMAASRGGTFDARSSLRTDPVRRAGAGQRLGQAPRGRLFLALDFTITDGKVTEIDVIADPDRLDRLDLAVLS